MPALPSEWLRNIGLVEFAPSAASDIWRYARTWTGIHDAESSQEDLFRAFIELGAVEFAMAPLYRGTLPLEQGPILEDVPPPDRILPIYVSDSAAADAVYKTDCGPFMEHLQKERSQLRPWDIFTFAGDMSKVELLGYSDDINVLADPKVMQTAMEALAERYDRAGLGNRVVESGLLAAQGVVWFAKLTLLRGEDFTEAQNLQFAQRYLPEIA